jgi:hypothetical protein
LTLNRRPPVIDHHNTDEPAMKNGQNTYLGTTGTPQATGK